MPTGDGSRNLARNSASDPPKIVSHHRVYSRMSGWRTRVSQSTGAFGAAGAEPNTAAGVARAGLARPADDLLLRRPAGRAGGRSRRPERPSLAADLSPRLMA